MGRSGRRNFSNFAQKSRWKHRKGNYQQKSDKKFRRKTQKTQRQRKKDCSENYIHARVQHEERQTLRQNNLRQRLRDQFRERLHVDDDLFEEAYRPFLQRPARRERAEPLVIFDDEYFRIREQLRHMNDLIDFIHRNRDPEFTWLPLSLSVPLTRWEKHSDDLVTFMSTLSMFYTANTIVRRLFVYLSREIPQFSWIEEAFNSDTFKHSMRDSLFCFILVILGSLIYIFQRDIVSFLEDIPNQIDNVVNDERFCRIYYWALGFYRHYFPTFDVDAQTSCPICFNDFDFENERDEIRILHCGHRFHCDCVNPWIAKKSTCPCCRQRVQ